MKDKRYVLEDRNVLRYEIFPTPEEVKGHSPLTDNGVETVVKGREDIAKILRGEDERLLVIAGPCSVHNADEANEYASVLKGIADDVSDKILVVMRTYFEKPRTSEGWQGLLNDPNLNGTNGTNGYVLARKILVEITDIGMPCGTEFVEMKTPQYIGDAMSWSCIGARTVESQPHRNMASGLSMPVGFKNSTSGSIKNAVDATIAASGPHQFLGIGQDGCIKTVHTRGNKYAHIVLRGDDNGPNYSSGHINKALGMLKQANLSLKGKYVLVEKILVDASHGNSCKDYRKQPDVFNDVLKQRADGNNGIAGMMLESYINEGGQKVASPKELKRGISITDSCISLDTTRKLLLGAYSAL